MECRFRNMIGLVFFFFFQAEDGIRDLTVTGVQTCALPISHLDELRKLPVAAANEMMALSQRMESVLRELYHPDGVNLGMNIGKAAGAGIEIGRASCRERV